MLPRLYLVEWVDACGTNRWEDRKGAIDNGELLTCFVVGRLIRVTKKDVMIAGGWSPENGNVTTLHIIPRENVVSFKPLRIGRPSSRVRAG